MEATPTTQTTSKSQVTNGTQLSSKSTSSSTQQTTPVQADNFSEFLKKALGGATKAQVSEEELFSALIEQRLETANKESAEYFRTSKEAFINATRRPDGRVSHETVALRALEDTARQGKITKEEAEKISGLCFKAAQLDNNATCLYDEYGSSTDLTVAVAGIDAAIVSAKKAVEELAKDESKITSRPLESKATGIPGMGDSGLGGSNPLTTSPLVSDKSVAGTPSGAQSIDGSGGFLWKPVSDSNKKLVVLMPKSLTDQVEKVELHSSVPPDSSTLVETGRFTGVANGDRGHYRFSKPGAEYGDHIYVVATKSNGELAWWEINKTGSRVD